MGIWGSVIKRDHHTPAGCRRTRHQRGFLNMAAKNSATFKWRPYSEGEMKRQLGPEIKKIAGDKEYRQKQGLETGSEGVSGERPLVPVHPDGTFGKAHKKDR